MSARVADAAPSQPPISAEPDRYVTDADAMDDAPTTVLLIEDDAADARLIKAALAGVGGRPFQVERATRLSDALERLAGSGLRAVPIAVNISAVEFRHRDFLEGVARILKETGLAPRYLELELTESVLMQDAESSVSVLEALKAMGVQLAIDDFGTGYSSLSYLKRFPIDTLKIDQSFVRDIATDVDNATLVSAMVGMGKNLKQRVIAEGVETIEQLGFLRTEQCDMGQGFYFGRPVSAEDFARLLVAE